MQYNDFLQDEFIEDYSRLCGVREEITQGIIVRKKEFPPDGLHRLKDAKMKIPEHIPLPLQPISEYLLALNMVPETIRKHKAENIPWKITRDTDRPYPFQV